MAMQNTRTITNSPYTLLVYFTNCYQPQCYKVNGFNVNPRKFSLAKITCFIILQFSWYESVESCSRVYQLLSATVLQRNSRFYITNIGMVTWMGVHIIHGANEILNGHSYTDDRWKASFWKLALRQESHIAWKFMQIGNATLTKKLSTWNQHKWPSVFVNKFPS